MAIRTYKVTLDSKNTIAPEPVFLRQGDKTGAVVIDAMLMDNGTPVSLSGLTPMFKANTADSQAVIADSTGFNITDASAGEFTYQVPNALSSVPGKITTAYFSFSDSSGSESTFDVSFVIKSAVDINQKQAEDYITIIDGTLDSLRDQMDSLKIDFNKIINNYNQGDFYNKSETDNKDAATLASAKSYADSGDSNALYNAKTYTDNSLSGIVALPETFANLTAIQAKYPNGANGVMVAADNGHKYIWANNVWTDAGVYQSVGIADGSVTDDKTNFLKTIRQYVDSNARTANSYYNFSHDVGWVVGITGNASGFFAYDKIFIKKGMTVSILNCKLFFSGVVDLNNKKIIRFSDSDTIGDYEYTAIQDCYILVTATSLIPKIINIELRNVTESMRNSEKGTLSVEISGISIPADNNEIIADGSISPSKTNFITVINQALDKSNATENAYWNFTASGAHVGQTTNAPGMWAYNKVHVNRGETWSILQARLIFSGFTDILGNKVSQFSTTDITGDIEYTADQDGYICVSGTTPKVINLPLADINDDMRTSPMGVIGTWITGIYLSADNHKKITVSTASGLMKAINDLSNDTNYSDATIYLKEGVYDLYTAMGGASYIASVDAAASGEMFGLNLPDRVSLVGNPHATITFEVPDNVATKTSSTRISVISILHTHTLENLDIIGKNVRYAVHDETGNGVSGLTRVVKNCHIEHLGNASGLWSSTQAYAIGTGSGGSYDFENTVFKSVTSAWSAHDNANQKDNTFTFNHCKFVTGSDYSIRFSTYGSGDNMNHVTINNCDIDKYIYVMEEAPGSKNGMRFKLKGSGNTKVPYWSVNSAGARLPIEFCDETARITNIGTDTIKDGTPIKLTDIGKGIAMGPTDAVYLAYGIALEDIAPGENGVVKYAGYLSRDDTPLSSLTVGSRIGIIDGKLAQTNDNDYIGIVTQWRNILLRF